MSPAAVEWGIGAIMISIVLDLLVHIIQIGQDRPAIKGVIVAVEAVMSILALWVLYRALEIIQ